MPIVEFNPKLSIKQTEAWDCLERPDIDEILYGGAKYGGKSWFLCVWAYLFACSFTVQHNIPQTDNPLPVGFLGRKVAKNFSDTTLETWFKTIPAEGYVAKGKPTDLIIDDRLLVYILGDSFANENPVHQNNKSILDLSQILLNILSLIDDQIPQET